MRDIPHQDRSAVDSEEDELSSELTPDRSQGHGRPWMTALPGDFITVSLGTEHMLTNGQLVLRGVFSYSKSDS